MAIHWKEHVLPVTLSARRHARAPRPQAAMRMGIYEYRFEFFSCSHTQMQALYLRKRMCSNVPRPLL